MPHSDKKVFSAQILIFQKFCTPDWAIVLKDSLLIVCIIEPGEGGETLGPGFPFWWLVSPLSQMREWQLKCSLQLSSGAWSSSIPSTFIQRRMGEPGQRVIWKGGVEGILPWVLGAIHCWHSLLKAPNILCSTKQWLQVHAYKLKNIFQNVCS
jgi:hypothetical protein